MEGKSLYSRKAQEMNIRCEFPDCECAGPERCEKVGVVPPRPGPSLLDLAAWHRQQRLDAALKLFGEEELKKVLAEDEEAPTE